MHDERTRARRQGAGGGGDEPKIPEVISSDGMEAGRAYVGPTALPELARPPVDTQRVKIPDPQMRAMATTAMKVPRVPGVQAPHRGAIAAPLERPAGAFQPVAVDPSLVQEWAARRGGQGATGAGGDSGVGAGAESPWATTAKIDRSMLPSSHAPGRPAGGVAEGEREADTVVDTSRPAPTGSGRGVWLPLIVTVCVGMVAGLLVIWFVFIPKLGAGSGPASTTSAITEAPPAVPTMAAPPPSGAVVAPSSSGAVGAEPSTGSTPEAPVPSAGDEGQDPGLGAAPVPPVRSPPGTGPVQPWPRGPTPPVKTSAPAQTSPPQAPAEPAGKTPPSSNVLF